MLRCATEHELLLDGMRTDEAMFIKKSWFDNTVKQCMGRRSGVDPTKIIIQSSLPEKGRYCLWDELTFAENKTSGHWFGYRAIGETPFHAEAGWDNLAKNAYEVAEEITGKFMRENFSYDSFNPDPYEVNPFVYCNLATDTPMPEDNCSEFDASELGSVLGDISNSQEATPKKRKADTAHARKTKKITLSPTSFDNV